MSKFKVEYTADFGTTTSEEIVEAEDETKAYLAVYAKIPLTTFITDLKEIK